MKRYDYHLLPLFGRIAGAVSGSGDGMTLEDATQVHAWLEWRIHQGWDSPIDRMSLFDSGVRMLGLAALETLRTHIERLKPEGQ